MWPRAVPSPDGTYRGNKKIPLKDIADEAVKKCKGHGFEVSKVIVAKNLPDETCPWVEGRDLWWGEEEVGNTA